jgi:hypothetical protein
LHNKLTYGLQSYAATSSLGNQFPEPKKKKKMLKVCKHRLLTEEKKKIDKKLHQKMSLLSTQVDHRPKL